MAVVGFGHYSWVYDQQDLWIILVFASEAKCSFSQKEQMDDDSHWTSFNTLYHKAHRPLSRLDDGQQSSKAVLVILAQLLQRNAIK